MCCFCSSWWDEIIAYLSVELSGKGGSCCDVMVGMQPYESADSAILCTGLLLSPQANGKCISEWGVSSRVLFLEFYYLWKMMCVCV